MILLASTVPLPLIGCVSFYLPLSLFHFIPLICLSVSFLKCTSLFFFLFVPFFEFLAYKYEEHHKYFTPFFKFYAK